jgi:16S rRNA (cytosine1402-N4)-methyltransferase
MTKKNNENETYHIPVMLQPCIEGLNILPDGIYVDVTFGGGGHSREIFKHLSDKGKLIVFDQDSDAKRNAWKAPNFLFIPSNFTFLKNHLKANGIMQVDGILADLGVSSYQFDQSGNRGFSIRFDDPLDMRMNQSQPLSAKQVVNTYSEEQLATVFGKYGENERPMRIAVEICKVRSREAIKTTFELIEVIKRFAPRHKEQKFYAQVFQAIRIEVNNEMDVLEKFLVQAADMLKPGGRLVVMSYHSLEDRLVKNFMKRGNLDGTIEKDFYGNVLKPFDEVNRKPISPTTEEMEQNPRARSAKLRIAIKR